METGGNKAKEAALLCGEKINQLGMDLVDVKFVKEGKNMVLRFFIDKRGGVGIEDCQLVSRNIDALLDEKFSYPGSYLLEVSSPGIDRALTTDADLKRHDDEELLCSFYRHIDGKKEVTAYLKDFDNENVVLDLTDDNGDKNGITVTYPRKLIAKIKRNIRF